MSGVSGSERSREDGTFRLIRASNPRSVCLSKPGFGGVVHRQTQVLIATLGAASLGSELRREELSTLKPVVTAEDVVRELTSVFDPEIGLDIVNLGLVYEVAVEGETARIWMTFTTPQCPVGPYIEADVRQALENLPMIEHVEINLVWDPPWDLTMMSSEAKSALGIAD